MTNAEIIAIEMFTLIKDGTITADEEIHTFAMWKAMGYSIKKGEKAIAKFPIWKFTSKETEDGNTDDKMFMKMSCFFSTRQVTKVVKEDDKKATMVA